MTFYVVEKRFVGQATDWSEMEPVSGSTRTTNEQLARARYNLAVEERRDWEKRSPTALNSPMREEYRLVRCEVIETTVDPEAQ